MIDTEMAEIVRLELRKGGYQMIGDTVPYETQAANIAAKLTEAGYGRIETAKKPVRRSSCPVRLMDGRNEISCWLEAEHEGECK